MNYISLDNLTRYHINFRNYGDATYALTRGSLWKQTEKAGAVTCWPIGNSRLKPVVEFKFKETLPVSDKSEQNPSTITGVSSVKVTRCGKNLFKRPYQTAAGSTIHTTTFTVDSETGIITANTPTSSLSNAPFWMVGSNSNVRLAGGNTYYLSGCPSGGSENTYRLGLTLYSLSNVATGPNFYEYGAGCAVTPSVDCHFVTTATVRAGATVSNLVFKPQLELGSTASSFEPYAGADYTLNFNNTYYGGILDVSTGKLTVTHRMVEADSLTLDISNYPAYLPLDCTDTFGRTITSTGNILALTGSTGGKIVYKLANPYTVQIDPIAITALPQVDKYTPRINTLYTDAENITVGYQKSPIRDEYEKVQAIIANGGTI